MASSIFFPYFYLSNDTLIRHQYLYVPSLLRVHPCDRPPRDNKQVKRFISELMQVGFLENVSQETFDPGIQNRFLSIIERGFEKNLPLYLKHLGKYEKERASAKTFHLCRKKLWEELVKRVQDLGIATVDNYDEWCFSTRMMVMVMTICVVLDHQRKKQLPRCTDMVEYDELATLIECMPLDDGQDSTLRRAILEFPYPIPQDLNPKLLDRLMTLRDDLTSITENFQSSIQEDAADMQRSASLPELEERIKYIGNRIQDIYRQIEENLQSHNEIVQIQYCQYRWYVPPDAPLNGLVLENPIIHNQVAFTMIDTPIAPPEINSVLSTPGCLIWAQDAPGIGKKSGNFLKRLFSFGKS